jgi:hypothetical protein
MLRIFLYSAIIIGCFANFARNGWGFELKGYAELILGITFIMEIISSLKKKDITKKRGNRILTNFERFFIFLFFIANFFKAMHWPGGGILLVFSCGFILIFAFIRLNGTYVKPEVKIPSILTLIFYFLTIMLLSSGVLFKTMHWPFGGILITLGFIGFILVLILGVTQKISVDEKNQLRHHITAKYSAANFVFFYFGVWSIYIVLAQNNFAPKFYSSQNPYVYEKLLEEGKRDEAELIHQNYSDLLQGIYDNQGNGKKSENSK